MYAGCDLAVSPFAGAMMDMDKRHLRKEKGLRLSVAVLSTHAHYVLTAVRSAGGLMY